MGRAAVNTRDTHADIAGKQATEALAVKDKHSSLNIWDGFGIGTLSHPFEDQVVDRYIVMCQAPRQRKKNLQRLQCIPEAVPQLQDTQVWKRNQFSG